MTKKLIEKLKTIAISVLCLLMIFGSVAFAATEIGRVAHLSGPLFVEKADGTKKVLSINSSLEQGDTLVTEKNTYARIKFTDNSEVILRPGTQLKIPLYNFDQAKPKADKIVISLFNGAIRAITGMIGKRGDQDSYRLETANAVAGVRGTTYECKICDGNCGSLRDGLYLFVIEGLINVSNNAGSQNVGAGQYVYVQTINTIPQLLPGNPGIDFKLPAFIGDSSEEDRTKKDDSGCVVR